MKTVLIRRKTLRKNFDNGAVSISCSSLIRSISLLPAPPSKSCLTKIFPHGFQILTICEISAAHRLEVSKLTVATPLSHVDVVSIKCAGL